ncbi:elongation factor 1-beta-like [Stylophora pistillata]|uniref:Elongation factor 1-beta n=1 Tax=Stylophora pistillata TaxID=50429 RepID=A0A2B4SES5_STYPI|nr:elongation factor 1-beta-like [Stylophora pistillata]PFX27553.1 Elongation factor 1-beta [Stylophora pistillata]
MGFGDLKSRSGLEALNKYLEDKSYIEGNVPSQGDNVVFQALSACPSADLAHALRWYNHIASFGAERASFPGSKKDLGSYGSAAVTNGSAKKNDDDDFDLFGSDSEEEEDDEETKKRKEEELRKYHEKKAKKKQVIAKSSILLDVKPWDDETDMKELERLVRSVEADGLLWGASKLVPLAYGIKKLQINCVVEDDKISTDFLEEEITKFEDFVQSVDIAAFNKI